jgi:methyltransferase
MDFIIFISAFIAQRISELIIARRNEKWLRAKGAVEYGKNHYPYIVLLHFFFILSLIFEYAERKPESNFLFLLLLIILLSAKIWTIASLGKYWNTKILRIPGMNPIQKGPYKIFKHPNYIIVICEFIVVPMVFHLYLTAILFSVLNALILRVRIRKENAIWATYQNYF